MRDPSRPWGPLPRSWLGREASAIEVDVFPGLIVQLDSADGLFPQLGDLVEVGSSDGVATEHAKPDLEGEI